ncbi:hypothetical protein L204_106161 [Cryptococcus depauperatus]
MSIPETPSPASGNMSLGDEWEHVLRSPSLEEYIQSYPTIEVDTSPINWGALYEFGLPPNHLSERHRVEKKESTNHLNKLFRSRQDLKKDMPSPSSSTKDNRSLVSLPSTSGKSPSAKRSFFKSIKIPRGKGKDKRKKETVATSERHVLSPIASNVCQIRPPEIPLEVVIIEARSGMENLADHESSAISSLHNHSDCNVAYEDAPEDIFCADAPPNLCFSDTTCVDNSEYCLTPTQERGSPSLRKFHPLSTIVENSPECSAEPSATSTPQDHLEAILKGTYTDHLDFSEHADDVLDPLFFDARQVPLPVGHLATFTITRLHTAGLVPSYEMEIIWEPHNRNLPVCRITVTRGFGQMIRFSNAIYKAHSPGASSALSALLLDFPHPIDGPPFPDKMEYRAMRIQRYFEKLFGVRTMDGSAYILDHPRITPEFFALLHRDQVEIISRELACNAWKTIMNKQGNAQKWQVQPYGLSPDNCTKSSLSQSQPQIKLSNGYDSTHWSNALNIDDYYQSEQEQSDEESEDDFCDIINVFPYPPARVIPLPKLFVTSSSDEHLSERCNDSEISNYLSSSAISSHANVSIDSVTCQEHSSSLATTVELQNSECKESALNDYQTQNDDDNSSVTTIVSSNSDSDACTNDVSTPRITRENLQQIATSPSPPPTVAARQLHTVIPARGPLNELNLKNGHTLLVRLTTRHSLETVQVYIDAKGSWSDILCRIYSVLNLPIGSCILKGDIPQENHVIGQLHGKEILLTCKKDFDSWLEAAGDPQIWVETR